jgi:ribosome recycling factor
MSKDDILLDAEMSMEKSVDYMVHEFAAVRTGKASPGLVENVDVHAYGSTMKLKQLALITTPEPRLLVVQPFDAGTVQDIEKALKESKIGIMPAVDGKIIRLPIPELSEERRKELVRSLSKMAEEARVRVRANRRTAIDEAKKLKASGELTEDGFRDAEEEVQKLTDRFVKSVDDHLKHKEAEVMMVEFRRGWVAYASGVLFSALRRISSTLVASRWYRMAGKFAIVRQARQAARRALYTGRPRHAAHVSTLF